MEAASTHGVRSVVGVGVIAAVVGAALLEIGQGLGFFEDDWEFIVGRPFTLQAATVRWGEHLPFLHFIVFRSLYEISGGSYVVLHLALIAIHVTVAAGLFALLRREGARWYALGAAAVFLLAAPGRENTMWAFQIGFVGAMAFGIWALWARDPRVAAVLLCMGAATTGSVVPFLGAALLRSVLARDRRAFYWLLIPTLLYGLWLVVGGAAAEQAASGVSWQAAALDAPAYIGKALETLGAEDLRFPLR